MRNIKQKLGQFLTNPIIADFMSELVYFDDAKTVLDPAVGEGVFIQYLEQQKTNELRYVAYDIDKAMIEKSKNCVSADVQYIHQDYLMSAVETHPDIIICNPPYNKFQEISNRDAYIERFKEKYNFCIGGYSNLCVYFLMKSLFELKDGGKCAYIIPYEFLNTGYGERIKEFFVQSRYLKTIYKFDSKLSVFDDAITTSCILVFEKKTNESVEFVLVEDIDEIQSKKFRNISIFSYEELDYKEKWNSYFSVDQKNDYNNLIAFSKIAKVKRGIATGGNAFFTLNKEKIESLGLSDNVLVKCICKSPDVKKLVFQEGDFQNLYLANKKVYLFDGEKSANNQDLEYIAFGEKEEYNKRYLNSHRSPWYALENKEVAPIWISVFNRASLKVVRNNTKAKNLTTFHGVYLNEGYDNEEYSNILFCYLLTPICHRILQKNKREYGGGLDKFEPNDLNEALIIDISLITSEDVTTILDLYAQLKMDEGNSSKIIDKLNDIFQSYIA